MQDSLNTTSDDEIDLRELFISLWAYKFFIAITCTLSIVYAGFYALNVNKEFTSTAIFKLDGGKIGSAAPFGGTLGVLAGISGLGGAAKMSLPVDQVKGRIFIEQLDAQLKFKSDPFFNRYNPNAVDPFWKATLKRLIGWRKPSSDQEEEVWQVIVQQYSDNVTLDSTDTGAFKVTVKHDNALRAAEIANVVMTKIIEDLRVASFAEQDNQLSFLSMNLAMALSDLEKTQSNLKTFALQNSALPLESFAAGSLQLDSLRDQLSRTSELHDAVAELMSLLQRKATSQEHYQSLRQKFPIVDQAEFRRVLGQNEIISSWSWPNKSSVAAVFDTLSERKSRLETQISVSLINGERFGEALKVHAKLEREAKVAEATYTVLIEQVKAQSMISSYRPEKSEIYEYATPSIRPSGSNRNLVVALGAVLGLLVGCTIALVLALRRGVHFSKKSLIKASQARFKASARPLIALRKQNLNDLNSLLTKKTGSVLRDLVVEIHKSGTAQVVVTSSRAKLTANDAARALASSMQSENLKVAIIDFSQKEKKLIIDAEIVSAGPFVVTESEGQISVLMSNNDFSEMAILSQRDFVKNLQSLNNQFDLVFVCADNGDAISLLRSVEGQRTFHITLARTKHTKSATLLLMRSLAPIQGWRHD